jgi:hypothetical protein
MKSAFAYYILHRAWAHMLKLKDEAAMDVLYAAMCEHFPFGNDQQELTHLIVRWEEGYFDSCAEGIIP